VQWATASALAAKVIRRLAALNWPRDSFFNVNFPNVPPAQVKGIVAAAQGGRKIGDHLLQRLDPRGRPYYWIGPQRDEAKTRAGSDVRAVGEGKISITPIFLDLTNRKALADLKKALRERTSEGEREEVAKAYPRFARRRDFRPPGSGSNRARAARYLRAASVSRACL